MVARPRGATQHGEGRLARVLEERLRVTNRLHCPARERSCRRVLDAL